MAVINDPNVAANIGRVGEVDTSAAPGTDSQHVTLRPIPTSIGHYRTAVRFAIIALQGATTRLFEARQPTAGRLFIPTRLEVRWLQIAAHTAAILDAIDLFKLTTFTVVDTTGTVTPTASLRRTGMGALTAQLRHVTVAGAAGGMTGGTMTKDGNAGGMLEQWLLAAVPTAGPVSPVVKEFLDDVNGTHPWAFIQNEGFELENRILLGAGAGSSVIVDLSAAEVAAY